MLKKAIILASVLIVLSFSACGKAESILSYQNADYEVTEFDWSHSDDELPYDIKYPQISGLKDNDKQEAINRILKNEALKVFKYYEDQYGVEFNLQELSIDYEIGLKGSNILSVQYSDSGMVEKAAHPDHLFYTTNISIKSGERLRLSDIVNIDRDFADKFINGEFKAVWDFQGEEIDLTHYSNEEIQKYFQEADSLDNIGTEKQSDVFSYYTTDSLGISIRVPYAIGDHAEFEIKYQDMQDNITQNEIWEDFHDVLSVNSD